MKGGRWGNRSRGAALGYQASRGRGASLSLEGVWLAQALRYVALNVTELDPHQPGSAPREVVSILRRPGCPGVDLIQAHNTLRSWGHLNGAFAFGSMWDWQGRLEYRRQSFSLARGDTLVFDAGEFFHATPADERPGAFGVLEILPETFEALCKAEGRRAPIHFARGTIKAAPLMAKAVDALHAALLQDADPLEQQSRLAVLTHAAVTTCLEPGLRAPTKPVPLGPCERLREMLHESDGTRITLCDFARDAGVSQFQLLRAFKRRYGLPPHAYGLHVRVERARQMLRHGFSVAQAAAANDFTDQSHFTRHFRRIHGVSPGRYATSASLKGFAIARAPSKR